MADAKEAKPETLIEKLAAVMAAVERVPKHGENKFHGYKYATEADLSDAVRSNLARYGVMLIPSVEKVEWSKVPTKNGEERLATLTVKFTATDGKTEFSFVVLGEGQDRGDKATYKAMTGATKYALLKLFLIPTGDDPEKDDGDEKSDRRPARPDPKSSDDAAARVRAAAARRPEQRPIPANPEARKQDIKARMMKAGIPGAKLAEQLAEWIGRPVDKDTVITADDWTRADAAIEQAKTAAEVLGRAQDNGAHPAH